MTHSSPLHTRALSYIALFAVLMVVCAWITIPFVVPFTLQTFALFMTLTTLGGRRGTYTVVVYLLLGVIGLPVFSGFQSGLSVLLGATGGYALGFLCAAAIYWLLTAKWGTSRVVTTLACLAGLLVCYSFGTIWFFLVYACTTGTISLFTVLTWCVFPFIIPDLVKLSLAMLLSSRIKPYLK